MARRLKFSVNGAMARCISKGGARMPRCINPAAAYHAKLAAAPPEEAAKMEANRRAKMSAGVKKTRAIQRIVNAVLKAEVDPNSYQTDILKTFGYEIEDCGVPTVAVMILLHMAYKACKGDVKAAEFLFSYGGIPNMNQMIRREELEILRHKGDPKDLDIDRLEAIKLLLAVPSAIE